MSVLQDINVPGSDTSRRGILWLGVVIGISWILIYILFLCGVLIEAVLSSYTLGSQEGFLAVQLLAHPFVHLRIEELIFDLLWLTGLVRIAHQWLSLNDFIRAWTLGCVGGGLLLIGLCHLFHTEHILFQGGHITLTAVLGVIAALRPKESVCFLISKPVDLTEVGALIMYDNCGCLFFLLIGLALTNNNLWHTLGDSPLVLYVVFRTISFLILLLIDTRITVVAAILLFPDLILVYDFLKNGNQIYMKGEQIILLTYLIGFGAGLLYGTAVRTWRRQKVANNASDPL